MCSNCRNKESFAKSDRSTDLSLRNDICYHCLRYFICHCHRERTGIGFHTFYHCILNQFFCGSIYGCSVRFTRGWIKSLFLYNNNILFQIIDFTYMYKRYFKLTIVFVAKIEKNGQMRVAIAHWGFLSNL